MGSNLPTLSDKWFVYPSLLPLTTARGRGQILLRENAKVWLLFEVHSFYAPTALKVIGLVIPEGTYHLNFGKVQLRDSVN